MCEHVSETEDLMKRKKDFDTTCLLNQITLKIQKDGLAFDNLEILGLLQG